MGCTYSISALDGEDGPIPGERSFFCHEYNLGKKLGQGACGQVFTAKRRASSEKVPSDLAAKVINIQTCDARGNVDERMLLKARREARTWKTIGEHLHCVRLFEAYFEYTGQYLMLMERCRCTLKEYLIENIDMTEADLRRIFKEMLLGLGHVHNLRIVHRDVKPDNFMVGGPDSRTLKLADFGLAVHLPKKGLLKGVCGTAPYMSPEMLGELGYDGRTDIWSVGAIAYMLLYKDYVHSPEGERTSEAVKRATKTGHPEPTFVRPSHLAKMPEHAEAFVRALLERQAAVRCSAHEALDMPFMQGDTMTPDTCSTASPSSAQTTPSSSPTHASPVSKRRQGEAARAAQELLAALPAPSHRSRRPVRAQNEFAQLVPSDKSPGTGGHRARDKAQRSATKEPKATCGESPGATPVTTVGSLPYLAFSETDDGSRISSLNSLPDFRVASTGSLPDFRVPSNGSLPDFRIPSNSSLPEFRAMPSGSMPCVAHKATSSSSLEAIVEHPNRLLPGQLSELSESASAMTTER